MRKEYDFSKSVKNPYAKKVGIPYQNLMNSYLKKRVQFKLKKGTILS